MSIASTGRLGPLREVVVVGAGLAGLRSVVELRDNGYDGRLTLLGGESSPPYDRPPLSKELLAGTVDDTTLEADWATLDVELVLGRSATAVRPGRVETIDTHLPFDGLVVATGALPVLLPGDGALTLRTATDALLLRERLAAAGRVVIVGAGWIGAEVATAAAAAGCRVTAVDVLDEPLAHALPRSVGADTRPWWLAAGVELRLGERVERADGDGVLLATGERLAADLVLVGVGVRPATGWLVGSDIRLDDGGAVMVDEHLRASVPGVVAVGDAATRWSRRYGTRLRLEHWDEALRSPAVAATSLLGDDDVYDPVPYVWSEQLGHHLQYAGHRQPGDLEIRRGDPSSTGWSVVWLGGPPGRRTVSAVFAADRPRDLLQARRLADRGIPVDSERLADIDVPVRDTALEAAA